MPDAITTNSTADLKPPDGGPCPSCGRLRDVKRRCWVCFNRPCQVCGVMTGGAFFPHCIAHQDRDAKPPDPVPAAERWVLVLEPEPGDVPPVIRVRHILKFAKRLQGMRCVGLPNDPPATARTAEPLEAE